MRERPPWRPEWLRKEQKRELGILPPKPAREDDAGLDEALLDAPALRLLALRTLQSICKRGTREDTTRLGAASKLLELLGHETARPRTLEEVLDDTGEESA